MMISTICAKDRTHDNIHLGDIGGKEPKNPLKCNNKVQAKEKSRTCSAFL
jgi:hypothetical protein